MIFCGFPRGHELDCIKKSLKAISLRFFKAVLGLKMPTVCCSAKLVLQIDIILVEVQDQCPLLLIVAVLPLFVPCALKGWRRRERIGVRNGSGREKAGKGEKR